MRISPFRTSTVGKHDGSPRFLLAQEILGPSRLCESRSLIILDPLKIGPAETTRNDEDGLDGCLFPGPQIFARRGI